MVTKNEDIRKFCYRMFLSLDYKFQDFKSNEITQNSHI